MGSFIKGHGSLKRHLLRGAVILVGLFVVDCIFLAFKWPFTRTEVVTSLERFSASKVQMGQFHKTFFLHPGYVAENVTFARDSNGNATQLASVRGIDCRASWLALISLTHRVHQLRIEGLRVNIPAPVPAPMPLHPEEVIKTTVTELVADGAILEIAPRHAGGETLRFEFPRLTIGNVEKKKSMTFRTLVHNPEPPGDLRIDGRFGPFETGKLGQTPLSGTFDLAHADLSHYRVICGLLSTTGSFNGSLGHADLRGHAVIPDFEITSSHHAVGLSADFHSIVDGIHGNVSIENATAHFLHTSVSTHGKIGNERGEAGKTLSLHLDAPQARVEDLLRLFVKADQSPLYGAIQLSALAVLPPGHEEFLRRIRLDGKFDITEGHFARPNTQLKVDELSERARKQKAKETNAADPQRVVSDFEGDARVRDATAFLSNALFRVPGAVARGQGTYNLITEAIDLHGTLAMQASLSKAAGGIKSIFLIPLDPFFKKKGAGAVLPVRITGTYSHPVFGLSLTGKK